MSMRLKIIIAVIAGSMFAAATVGPALAHECFVANRPAQGNAGASNSQRWLTLNVEEFFSDPEIGLTAQQIEDALELWDNMGNPDSFTIFIGNHTIAEGTPGMDLRGHASDGRGIDHLGDAYFGDFVTVVCTVAPANPICGP